MTWSIAKMNFS